jgi:DMSO/TMAO reductase YedYZ molybdopterin-dependent catalytic subunit
MSRLNFAAVALAFAAIAPVSAWAVPSTSVVVFGQVGTPTTFGLSGLQALPQATQTETCRAAGSPVTDTFSGPIV